jgi:hypothetical protein
MLAGFVSAQSSSTVLLTTIDGAFEETAPGRPRACGLMFIRHYAQERCPGAQRPLGWALGAKYRSDELWCDTDRAQMCAQLVVKTAATPWREGARQPPGPWDVHR